MWFRIFNIMILSVSIKSVDSSICFWDSGCPYKYFASETPYNVVRGDIRDSIIKIKGMLNFISKSKVVLINFTFCRFKNPN